MARVSRSPVTLPIRPKVAPRKQAAAETNFVGNARCLKLKGYFGGGVFA